MSYDVELISISYFFLPRPDPGPKRGLGSMGVLPVVLGGLLRAFLLDGCVCCSVAIGQPDTEWCAVYFPVTWPEPSQPAVGHLGYLGG